MGKENKSPLDLLMGKQVAIRQGEEGAESSLYYTGKITRFGFGPKGEPVSVILDDGSQVIPYDPNITTVSLITGKSN